MVKENVDGLFFHNVNLWKSPDFYRVDSGFFKAYPFCRLWNATRKLEFDVKGGLHQRQHPSNIFNISFLDLPYCVVHFGFVEPWLSIKYNRYKEAGQSGEALDRINPDSKAVLEPFDKSLLPLDLLSEVGGQ